MTEIDFYEIDIEDLHLLRKCPYDRLVIQTCKFIFMAPSRDLRTKTVPGQEKRNLGPDQDRNNFKNLGSARTRTVNFRNPGPNKSQDRINQKPDQPGLTNYF